MHYAAAEQAQATSGSIIKPRWRDVLQIAGVGIAATALFFQVGSLPLLVSPTLLLWSLGWFVTLFAQCDHCQYMIYPCCAS